MSAHPLNPPDCLGCSRLEAADAATVTLAGGQVVCTYCPAWLAETGAREALVRRLLTLPDRSARINRLAEVAASHGEEFSARARAALVEAWPRRHELFDLRSTRA